MIPNAWFSDRRLILFLVGLAFSGHLFSQPCTGVVVDGGLPGTYSACLASQATLQAAPGLSYLWQTGATTQNLTVGLSGLYFLTVTNSDGCSGIDSILVSLIPEPTAPEDTVLCHGASLTLGSPVQGPNSHAIQFNGTSSYLTIPSAGLASGAASRAFEMWVNHSAQTDTAWIFQYGNATPGHAFGCFFTPANQLVLQVENQNYILDNSFLPGVWNHIVVAVDNDQKYQYFLNGSFVQTNTLTGGINTMLNDSIWVGRSASTMPIHWFQGYIDEFRVWNKHLSTSEVYQNLYRKLPYTVDPQLKRGYSFSDLAGGFYWGINRIPAHPVSLFNSIWMPFPNFLFLSQWGNVLSQQTIIQADTTTVYPHSLSDGINTCTDSLLVDVVQGVALPANLTACNASSLSLDAGAGFGQYLWSTGATTQETQVLTGGMYAVTVSTAGCTTSDSVQVQFMGISILESDTSLCPGQPITVHAQAIGGSVLWSNGATGTTQTLNPGANTTLVAYVNAGQSLCYDVIAISVHPPVMVGLPDVQTWCNTSAIGLTVPYVFPSYHWNNGQTTQWITVSQPGNYKVTVTDSFGCVGIDSTQMNLFAFNLIPNDTLLCDGVPVVVTVQTNMPGSSLVWSNGNTGYSMTLLPSTTTLLTVSSSLPGNQNCADEVLFTVGWTPQADLPELVSSCHSGLINLNVVPQSGVQYHWSNGLTTAQIEISQPGWYHVTVTDQVGCSATDSSHVSIFEVDLSPLDTTVCEGEQVMLAATGPTSYQYNWTTGQDEQVIFVNPLTTSVYEVSVSDGFAVCPYQALINVIDVPTGAIQGPAQVDPGSTFTYSVNDHPGSLYFWFVSGGSYVPGNGSTLDITWGTEGFGFIEVTEVMDNGCEGVSEILNVSIGNPASVAEMHATDLPRVYPNPFYSELVVRKSGGIGRVTILNEQGQEVFRGDFPESDQVIHLSSLPQGFYFVRLGDSIRPTTFGVLKIGR